MRQVMIDHYPRGFDQRFPGKRQNAVIARKALTSLGSFHEVSGDGHEKLSSLALRMGGIGLPIYGLKDKYSDALLKLVVIPNCRTAAAIGHLYLDFIEEIGGKIDLQLIR